MTTRQKENERVLFFLNHIWVYFPSINQLSKAHGVLGVLPLDAIYKSLCNGGSAVNVCKHMHICMYLNKSRGQNIAYLKAEGNKNTLGELCLKMARLVLIFSDGLFSFSSFSGVKHFFYIQFFHCLCSLFKIWCKAKAVRKSLMDV